MVLIEIEDINEPPVFEEAGVVRTVLENSASGVLIGGPIKASDPDDPEVRYSDIHHHQARHPAPCGASQQPECGCGVQRRGD